MSESIAAVATVQLKFGKASRGKVPVTVMQGSTVLLADRIDPHSPNQIKNFIRQAKKEFPALDGDGVRSLVSGLLRVTGLGGLMGVAFSSTQTLRTA